MGKTSECKSVELFSIDAGRKASAAKQKEIQAGKSRRNWGRLLNGVDEFDGVNGGKAEALGKTCRTAREKCSVDTMLRMPRKAQETALGQCNLSSIARNLSTAQSYLKPSFWVN